jgi:hypothetical protein
LIADDVVPVAPLVVGSDDGLKLFRSVEAARGWLELPDVEDGVYGPAFDAEGRLLRIELPAEASDPEPPRGPRRITWRLFRGSNPIRVRLLEEHPTHQSQLVELLASALGEPLPSDIDRFPQTALDDLLARAVARYGVIGW